MPRLVLVALLTAALAVVAPSGSAESMDSCIHRSGTSVTVTLSHCFDPPAYRYDPGPPPRIACDRAAP